MKKDKPLTGERKWTSTICELLNKKLDTNKYEIVCEEEIPYTISLNGNIDDNKKKEFHIDLLISEKLENGRTIPRLAIESKLYDINTHDPITYNYKAGLHKRLYPGLRYGLMVGEYGKKHNKKGIPTRVVEFGDNFDFMILFNKYKPTNEELDTFINILEDNLKSAEILDNIISAKKKDVKTQYWCINKSIKFEDVK